MQYLHNNSMIGVHGRLKLTNCAIDSRWTCKITDVSFVQSPKSKEEQRR